MLCSIRQLALAFSVVGIVSFDRYAYEFKSFPFIWPMCQPMCSTHTPARNDFHFILLGFPSTMQDSISRYHFPVLFHWPERREHLTHSFETIFCPNFMKLHCGLYVQPVSVVVGFLSVIRTELSVNSQLVSRRYQCDTGIITSASLG